MHHSKTIKTLNIISIIINLVFILISLTALILSVISTSLTVQIQLIFILSIITFSIGSALVVYNTSQLHRLKQKDTFTSILALIYIIEFTICLIASIATYIVNSSTAFINSCLTLG